MTKEKKIKALLVALALALTFILVHSPHLSYDFSYKYPLHVDEWQHIAKAVQIADKGIQSTNPYFKNYVYHQDLEIGFHLFLAAFFRISSLISLDPITLFRFLPALSAVAAAFILFIFVYKQTENFLPALFAVIFFAGLKSNVNILGLWFFVPLTLAIPLIYLVFLIFIQAMKKEEIDEKTEERKKEKKLLLFIALIALLALIFVHPVSAVFVFLVMSSYLLVCRRDLIRSHFASIALIAILIISAFSLVFLHYIGWKINDFIYLLSRLLVFGKGWGHIEILYFLPDFYGMIPTALALIGLYPAVKKKEQRVFIFLPLVALLLAFLFANYSFSVLIPYQRAVYYVLIGLVPLSGLGLFFIISKLKEYAERCMERHAKRCAERQVKMRVKQEYSKYIALLAIPILFACLLNYYNLPREIRIYHLIDDSDYEAMRFLGENFRDNITLSPTGVSSAIYPISRNYVTTLSKGVFSGRDFEDTQGFMASDCDEKYKIIKKYDIDLILTKKNITCRSLKEIYSKNVFIYKVEFDEDFRVYDSIMKFYEYSEDKGRIYPEVIRRLQDFILEYPGSEYADDVQFYISFMDERYGNYDSALKGYNKLLEEHPGSEFSEYAGFVIFAQDHINNNTIDWTDEGEVPQIVYSEESIRGRYTMRIVTSDDRFIEQMEKAGIGSLKEYRYIKFWHKENRLDGKYLEINIEEGEDTVGVHIKQAPLQMYRYYAEPSLNYTQTKIDLNKPDLRFILKETQTGGVTYWEKAQNDGVMDWKRARIINFRFGEKGGNKKTFSYAGAVEFE